MKILLSWLQEFFPVPLETHDVANRLTLLGLEVDKIEIPKSRFSGVVIGEVLAVAPHPNAERLVVATVFDGVEQLQVVCGAKNCRANMKTALAKIGATLYEDEGKSWKVKRSKLRDVESFGMLCSEKELWISEETEGIMDYRGTAPVGTDIASLFSDPILEISLTPNLGHCLSVRGIARELAATFPCTIQLPEMSFQEMGEANPFQIRIEDRKGCDGYACRIVKNLKIGMTPDWIKRRLEAADVRSINCVVDVSNYVMLELGQPLHFFDLESLSGNTIVITSHVKALSLMTLDEQMRAIPQGSLLVCDGKKPIAFAGVMGGKETAVSDQTRHVLIEAAHFSPQAIRKGCKSLDLRSESSYRFERGTDPAGLEEALNRAAYLLQKFCGGTVCPGIAKEETDEAKPKKICLRIERINRTLGTRFSGGEIVEILSRMQLSVVKQEREEFIVEVPTYRNDIREEIDLVEEVARIFGYQNLPKHPERHISSNIPHAPLFVFEKKIREHLVAEGLQEWITCDLISPGLSSLAATQNKKIEAIEVLHPRSLDQSVLRISLLPGLLQAVKYNLDHQNGDLAAFEVGKIHFKEENQFHEMAAAGIVMVGKDRPHHWDPKPLEIDFFDLKGCVQNILEGLGIFKMEFIPSHLSQFHPGRQARLVIDDCPVGVLGEIHPQHATSLGIAKNVYFAELNLQDLYPFCRKTIQTVPFSIYPGSERDWTTTLNEEMPINTILKAISNTPSSYLERVLFVDLYQGERVEKGKKNATFRFFYRDTEKTIDQETVDREHQKIIMQIISNLL